MLKVWFVIYSGMFTAGSVGPFPQSFEVCKIEARMKSNQLRTAIRTRKAPDGRELSKREIEELLDIRYACVQSENKPQPNLY